jgi:hypothetical protein
MIATALDANPKTIKIFLPLISENTPRGIATTIGTRVDKAAMEPMNVMEAPTSIARSVCVGHIKLSITSEKNARIYMTEIWIDLDFFIFFFYTFYQLYKPE